MDAGMFVVFFYVWLASVLLAYLAGWFRLPFSLRVNLRDTPISGPGGKSPK